MDRVFLSLAVNRLEVPKSLLQETKLFYERALGMQILNDRYAFFPTDDDDTATKSSSLPSNSMAMELIPVPDTALVGRQRPSSSDAYWKIGVGLPDVNAAVRVLQQKGVRVGPASQFRAGGCEVGFLTHLRDPTGFYTIELLQDTFEQNFVPPTPAPSPHWPLATLKPKVGQLTLRVSNIEKSLAFYLNVLDMKLLCWYDVGGMFSLYFLAFTDEIPPNTLDPTAEVNREWTYQRSYTTLELQTSDDLQQGVTNPGKNCWKGVTISVSSLAEAKASLKDNTSFTGDITEVKENKSLMIKDPDQLPIYLQESSSLTKHEEL